MNAAMNSGAKFFEELPANDFHGKADNNKLSRPLIDNSRRSLAKSISVLLPCFARGRKNRGVTARSFVRERKCA